MLDEKVKEFRKLLENKLNHESLNNGEVLEISRELDALINKYYEIDGHYSREMCHESE